MARSLKDFAQQTVDNYKALPLPQEFLDKVGGIYASGDRRKIAATTTFLQNNLSPEKQAEVLSYLQRSTAEAPADAGFTVDTEIDEPAPMDVAEYGIDTEDLPDITSESGSLGEVNLSDEYDSLALEASNTVKQFLRGELSPQTISQLESISGEKSLAAGLGTGSASRNLTARDIAMTTEQLQEKGLAAAPSIAQLFEIKRQYTITTQTAIDQFDKNFGLQQAEFQNQVAQLGLAADELQLKEDQFYQSIALEYNKLITSTWQFTQDLAFRYRTTRGEGGDVDTSGLEFDSQALIADLSAAIG